MAETDKMNMQTYMADTVAKQADAMNVPVGHVQDAFAAALGAQQEMLKLNQEMAAEIAQFASRRMEAGNAFWQRVSACKTAADLASVQTEFWTAATSDYSREFQTLAQSAQNAWSKLGTPPAKSA
jgi:hypothetical protein